MEPSDVHTNECIWEDSTLRGLLLGPPLNCRNRATMLHHTSQLNAHIEGICKMLFNIYGDTVAMKGTCVDIRNILQHNDSVKQIICERAALIFTLHMEPEISAYFTQRDGGKGKRFTRRLKTRVLPLIVSQYSRNMYQSPDLFVLMACVMTEMWGGEKWSWEEAHRDSRIWHHNKTADGVGTGTPT